MRVRCDVRKEAPRDGAGAGAGAGAGTGAGAGAEDGAGARHKGSDSMQH